MKVEESDALAAFEKIAREVTAKEAEECDRDAKWVEGTMRAIQAAGLAGLVVPKTYGGLGMGLETMTKACEILGKQSASAGLCFGMHCVGAAVIAAKATEDQAERYLRPIAAGEHITTLALSEPGSGVHFYYPETTLTKQGEGYVANGTKSFSTNGSHADSYVVSTMSVDPSLPAGLFSCVIVQGDDRLEWQAPYEGMGMRGNSARTFKMTDLEIPANDLLGEEGDQIWYIFHVVAPYFLVSMAGSYLGVAGRAIDEVIEGLGQRDYTHNGQGPRYEPVVQHKLGTIWSQYAATRQLAYWAAQQADTGGEEALQALCSAKAEVGDCVVDVCNEALTLAGGKAYRDGAILGRLLRDARAVHVMAPSTDVLRTWAGKALLDIPILGS